jgi:hypothetical protein
MKIEGFRWLSMSSFSRKKVSGSEAMVKRYAHLTEAHTKSVVERMNKAVFEKESMIN